MLAFMVHTPVGSVEEPFRLTFPEFVCTHEPVLPDQEALPEGALLGSNTIAERLETLTEAVSVL
ncbi:MAG: hypothetical protein ACRDNS_02830, partial [Trebonia sp.]